MRRFIVFAALLGLTACGGPVTPEEEGTPSESQSVAREEVEAQGVGGDCGLRMTAACYCGQIRSGPTCSHSVAPMGTPCVWVDYRCTAAY